MSTNELSFKTYLKGDEILMHSQLNPFHISTVFLKVFLTFYDYSHLRPYLILDHFLQLGICYLNSECGFHFLKNRITSLLIISGTNYESVLMSLSQSLISLDIVEILPEILNDQIQFLHYLQILPETLYCQISPPVLLISRLRHLAVRFSPSALSKPFLKHFAVRFSPSALSKPFLRQSAVRFSPSAFFRLGVWYMGTNVSDEHIASVFSVLPKVK
jgi:hypothetical protein